MNDSDAEAARREIKAIDEKMRQLAALRKAATARLHACLRRPAEGERPAASRPAWEDVDFEGLLS